MRIQIKDKTGLTGIGNDVLDYLKGLKVGEEVIETSHSCMFGRTGTVYESKDGGGTCVKWKLEGNSWMGTTVTWGSRRISDVEVIELPPLSPRVQLESQIASLQSELEAWKSLGERLSSHEGRFEVEEELEKAKKALSELPKE